MKQIAFHDFPHDWPGIAEKLTASLAENNYFNIMSAITVIYQIARKYEYTLTEGREHLHAMTVAFFPKIQALLETALYDPQPTARDMECLILKTFWSTVYIDVSADIAEVGQFTKWMTLCQQILSRDLGELGTPLAAGEDSKVRDESSGWMARKWAI